MQTSWFLVYIAAIVLVADCHVQDLRIDIVPIQSRFAAVHDVKVTLKYTNDGKEVMGIYKWNLPQNGLQDPLFEVTRNGEPVEYVGPIFKRSAPTNDDIVYLAPGMTASTIVELSSMYDMTKTGNYMIQFKMNAGQILATINNDLRLKIMLSDDNDLEFLLQSTPIVLFAVGRRNQLIDAANEYNSQTRAQPATFASCTASQISSINTGINTAESYSNRALQYINAQSSGTTRYTTWFGTYTAANYGTLKSHFTKIQNAISTKSLSFDCSCPAGSSTTYAYVYPGQAYKIFLCGAYWRAPMTGTDSQGGTIIHEVAHFTVVAGTSDHAYGQSSCQALARSSPAKALANSDSLQYFAENNPALS